MYPAAIIILCEEVAYLFYSDHNMAPVAHKEFFTTLIYSYGAGAVDVWYFSKEHQTFSGTGELCTPTVELSLQKPMHVVLSPTGECFHI